jgi:hypothetical protein
MRKFLASALAALTLGGALAATASPAEAQRYYYGHGGYYGGYYGHHHHSDTAAVAAVAGIAGLALGSALASDHRRTVYYDSYYEAPRPYYYERRYYYEPRTCISHDWVWDPYIGRHVRIEREYAC